MIDMDEALRDYATRWSAEQPAAPDLDGALVRARLSRPSHRWPIVAAVTIALLVAGAVWVIAATRADRNATLPGHANRVNGAVLAAARSDIEPFMHGRYTMLAVRTTRAAALRWSGASSSAPDDHVWLIEARGDAQSMSPEGQVILADSYNIAFDTEHLDTVFAGFGAPRSLTSLGRVIDFGSDIGHAYDYRAVRTTALAGVRRYGKPSSIQAVRTSDFAAEMAMGTTPPPTDGPQVWLIQATGHFTCPDCRGPHTLQGRYVTLITGGGVSAFGITDQPIDLGRLGTVITLMG